jgi:hypothetical protein
MRTDLPFGVRDGEPEIFKGGWFAFISAPDGAELTIPALFASPLSALRASAVQNRNHTTS